MHRRLLNGLDRHAFGNYDRRYAVVYSFQEPTFFLSLFGWFLGSKSVVFTVVSITARHEFFNHLIIFGLFPRDLPS